MVASQGRESYESVPEAIRTGKENPALDATKVVNGTDQGKERVFVYLRLL